MAWSLFKPSKLLSIASRIASRTVRLRYDLQHRRSFSSSWLVHEWLKRPSGQFRSLSTFTAKCRVFVGDEEDFIYGSELLRTGQLFTIRDKERVHYLYNVMRARVGDYVKVFANGIEFNATIEKKQKTAIDLRLLSQTSLSNMTASTNIVLAMPPLKNRYQDWILVKGTELGMTSILPFESHHSQVPLGRVRSDRWHRLMIEAAEQCERCHVPNVVDYAALAVDEQLKSSSLGDENSTLLTVLNYAQQNRLFPLVCVEPSMNSVFVDAQALMGVLNAHPHILDALPTHPASHPQSNPYVHGPDVLNKQFAVPPCNGFLLVIGPEGGWSDREIQHLIRAQCESPTLPPRLVTLGHRVLRAETAAVYALSVIDVALNNRKASAS